MDELSAWLRENEAEVRVLLNALREGRTDGHIYSQWASGDVEAYPLDGTIRYFEAGAVGTEAGLYIRNLDVWVCLAGDGALGPHTIVSHSDTTGTGPELDELTDGSTTVLHVHSGDVAGLNPLDAQWYNPGDFGATAGTLNWNGTDFFEYRNFANGEDRRFGTTVAVPTGWSPGDSLKVDVHWRVGDEPGNGDAWHCEVNIAGADEGSALDEGWENSTAVYPSVTFADELQIDTITVATSAEDAADFVRLTIRRNSGDAGDDYTDNVEFLGARFYVPPEEVEGAVAFWGRTGGVLHPVTGTDDLAIGGVDSSAPFFVNDSGDLSIAGVATVAGIGDGGLTNYDLELGGAVYGMAKIGNGVIGRTSYKVGNIDLDGTILYRNIGGPVTGPIEHIFTESTGNSCRFAIAKSGVGNATYSSRSMLIAGPAPADTAMVTVGYWQGQGIFGNLSCDTVGSGADLGVQNDLEVEGDLFVDSVQESTSAAGIRFAHLVVLPKTSGKGIQVDTASPTFGWRDLRAEVRTRGVGSSDPNDTTYIGNVKAYTFSVGDEAWIEFHLPHDYVKGTDIHLHFHWSHNSATVTGGSITLGADVTYAKGFDQAAFAATVNPTLSPNASTTRYQHIVSEIQLSASAPSATQIDTDDLEPDGLILARVYLAANNITSSDGVPDPFIHEVDIHYQSTNIATKDKAPDFYT